MKKTAWNQFFVIFSAIMVLLIMAVIFYFSAQQGTESKYISGSLTDKLIHIFDSEYDELNEAEKDPIFQNWNHYVRKAAHFCEYAGLAFWVYMLVFWVHMLVFGCKLVRDGRTNFQTLLAAVGISFLYACSDELHQYFVPGRNGVFKDALWDSVGAVFGALIAAAVIKIVLKWRKSTER